MTTMAIRDVSLFAETAELRILEGAGHDPHEERTEEVMRAVRTFLDTDGATDVLVGASSAPSHPES